MLRACQLLGGSFDRLLTNSWFGCVLHPSCSYKMFVTLVDSYNMMFEHLVEELWLKRWVKNSCQELIIAAEILSWVDKSWNIELK